MEPVGSPAEVIRFGVFELNPRTGELRKQGLRVKLQEQPFQMLCMLLERPGELVTREELRAKLWSADTFVDFEHGLNKAMSKLREALGDDRETPRYIETLPRRGYRFLAPTVNAKPRREPAEPQATEPLTPARPASVPAPQVRWLAPAMALFLLVISVAAAGLLYRMVRGRVSPGPSTVSAAPIRSLAVLPLQNLSGDKNQQYFADGMTDELITDLAQMKDLRVISRTSVMHYKRTSEKLPQIARELGADAVVEGTVFRAGGRVRITAQLIDARSDRHIWANQYERDLKDVLRLQDEVARDIADAIRVELTPTERARLGSAHKVNPEAHEAYLEGSYYWDQFTVPGTRKSLGFFHQAIAKDPNYALGYSGLAKYYAAMYIRFGLLPRGEACPKGEAAARKAIGLDDSVSEPHMVLGALRFWCDWDFRGGESELKRAIRLNPSNSEAPRVYAVTLTVKGRGEEAIDEMERAVENDPMSAEVKQMFGWDYYLMRRYDQAARQYRKAAGINPKQIDSVLGLGNVYAQQGQLDLAIREYRKAIELAGGEPVAGMLSPLAYAYARAGKRREALEILTRMDRMPGVNATERAVVYVGLGDKQHALAWLEKAYQNHELGILLLKSDPVYDPLRSDPRFQALIRRIGL